MEFPPGWSNYHKASVEHRLVKEMSLLDKDVPHPEGLVLLDVGVGEGPYLQSYLARDFNIIGLDNHPDGFGWLKKASAWDNQRLNLLCSDAKRIPLRDASVDVVFMCQLLEHLNDPIVVLREAYRVLKPGGWLFLDVPWWHEAYRPISALAIRQLQSFKANRTPPLLLRPFFRYKKGKVLRRPLVSPFIKLLRLFPTFRGVTPEEFLESYVDGKYPEGNMHLHFYTPGEWRKLVETANFTVRTTTGAWLTPPPFNRLAAFNRIFLRVERYLPDAVLSGIGLKLIIATEKPREIT